MIFKQNFFAGKFGRLPGKNKYQIKLLKIDQYIILFNGPLIYIVFFYEKMLFKGKLCVAKIAPQKFLGGQLMATFFSLIMKKLKKNLI